ncbi:DEAD/DEAH box helicase [Priestia aryabhattai]|uniref:DEAD/DEAH box helicase n=1 Tax=Priestia aryabhattai TaxID=412384 RepID=UPI002E1AA765|nr:DEAD/DEAH box helicase [Priestia aryabhattai]MED4013778.1 DEAD/DEAH box helicase [Priestia aryabhattai]
MKPEKDSKQLLGVTRSKAKMYEYRVPENYHINVAKDPSQLFTLAIGVLGEISAHLNLDVPNDEYIKELRENLQFSAHFFDAYLQANFEKDIDEYLLLLGSASYYLCDLPGSSQVLIRRIDKKSLDLQSSSLEILLTWILYGDFSKLLEGTEGRYSKEIKNISQELQLFFEFGYQEQRLYENIRNLRKKAYNYGDSRELLFSDVINAVIKKRITNSSWKCLPYYSGLTIDKWEGALLKKNIVQEFWPAQHLLGKNNVLRGRSAIIQLPTSAGKTKSTELIVRSSFLSNRTSLAVIVAPFKALCHEISNSFSNAFEGEAVHINELSDVLQLDFEIDELFNGKQIVVVTPEKLLYVLRHYPQLSEKVGLIIYDEGHQFDSGARGVNYELLLTSLNSMITEDVQKVLISAVISNAEVVGQWLNKNENEIISGIDLTPTYRTIAFASWLDQLGRLEFINKENPDRSDFYVPRIIEQHQLRLKGKERNERFFPEKNSSSSIALYLGLKLVGNGSVAVFCGKKNSVSSLCEKVVDAYDRGLSLMKPFEVSDRDESNRMYFLYKCHFGVDAAISKSASLGILTHHGNIPHGIRVAVEYAMQHGLCKFVICTSTLAQGVNLPIRYLIITSLYQGAEKIKVRDFHNLIGRVGRSGMHTEGSIIFADPAIYDKGKRVKKEKWRWREIKRLLDSTNSEPCESSLLTIFQDLHSDDKKYNYEIDVSVFIENYLKNPNLILEGIDSLVLNYNQLGYTLEGLEKQIQQKVNAISAIESFLMAHWNEEGKENGIDNITELAQGTLAYSLADTHLQKKIIEVFKLIGGNISQNVPQDDKKKVFGKTLFGLRTVLSIENWSNSNLDALNNCKSFEELLVALWPFLASNVQNNTFNKCEQQEALREIALKWINGESFIQLSNLLKEKDVRIKNKKRRSRFKIEQVIEVCENTFGYEMMLFIGGVAEVIETKKNNDIYTENTIESLRKLQKKLKYGLPDLSSVILYELGFSDRVVALDLRSTLKLENSNLLRKNLIKRIKEEEDLIRQALKKYPVYFTSVLEILINN